MYKYITIVCIAILQGCSNTCTELEEIKNLPVIKASDKNLNCRQLEYEITETDSRTRTLKYQNANIVAYSEASFPCLFRANSAAKQGLIHAEQRLDYLFGLYEFKHCDKVKKLKRPYSLTNAASLRDDTMDDSSTVEEVNLPTTDLIVK